MLAVGNGDKIHGSLQSVRKCVKGADLPSAQDCFDLGPHLFNGVEVRAVWWKIEKNDFLSVQNLADGLYMVRAHVVHHNNISRM